MRCTQREDVIDSLVQHPGFQSAAAPFVVAVVVALVLARVRLPGVAVLAGTLTCVYLALGLDLLPLTATRRLVVVAIAAGVVGAALDRLIGPLRIAPGWAALAGAAAVVWMLFTALANLAAAQAIFPVLAAGVGVAVFGAVTAFGFDRLAARPIDAGAATLASGVCVGLSALLSASASLAQIALAMGASAGGYLVVALVRGERIAAGRSLTLVAGLVTGLVAAGAVILARLPWQVLPIFAAVPFAAGLAVLTTRPAWVRAIGVSAIALGVGMLAVAWTWHVARATGPASGY